MTVDLGLLEGIVSYDEGTQNLQIADLSDPDLEVGSFEIKIRIEDQTQIQEFSILVVITELEVETISSEEAGSCSDIPQIIEMPSETTWTYEVDKDS